MNLMQTSLSVHQTIYFNRIFNKIGSKILGNLIRFFFCLKFCNINLQGKLPIDVCILFDKTFTDEFVTFTCVNFHLFNVAIKKLFLNEVNVIFLLSGTSFHWKPFWLHNKLHTQLTFDQLTIRGYKMACINESFQIINYYALQKIE